MRGGAFYAPPASDRVKAELNWLLKSTKIDRFPQIFYTIVDALFCFLSVFKRILLAVKAHHSKLDLD